MYPYLFSERNERRVEVLEGGVCKKYAHLIYGCLSFVIFILGKQEISSLWQPVNTHLSDTRCLTGIYRDSRRIILKKTPGVLL